MLLPLIWEVRLHGVLEPGVGNRERIILQANQAVDMSQFFLMLAIAGPNNTCYPLRDNVYWFGGLAVNPQDWIMLFTGSGTPTTTQRDEGGRVIHVAYWGRSDTLFSPGIIPLLLRGGGLLLGSAPATPALPKGQTSRPR